MRHGFTDEQMTAAVNNSGYRYGEYSAEKGSSWTMTVGTLKNFLDALPEPAAQQDERSSALPPNPEKNPHILVREVDFHQLGLRMYATYEPPVPFHWDSHLGRYNTIEEVTYIVKPGHITDWVPAKVVPAGV